MLKFHTAGYDDIIKVLIRTESIYRFIAKEKPCQGSVAAGYVVIPGNINPYVIVCLDISRVKVNDKI